MNIVIIRRYFPRQTLGTLMAMDDLRIAFKAVTLELPYKDNKQGLSAIPEGHYRVVKHVSPKFGDCFWLPEVLGREQILIHAGNFSWNTTGCLLVGREVTKIDNDALWDINHSKETLQTLLDILPSEFQLTITSVP